MACCIPIFVRFSYFNNPWIASDDTDPSPPGNARHIASEGLEQAHRLPKSERHDSVLCALVADINFDGRNEIVIGTYGQRVLAYARAAEGNDCAHARLSSRAPL